MKALRYAITGANGQIGAFLVKYLRERGHVVYELVRSIEKARDKNHYKFFDLAKPESMPSLQNIDVLVHAAYFFNATDKNYAAINSIGTQKLFHQASKDQVKYQIFISTISAHASAHSLYGRIKYQLEQSLKLENSNIVIIRPGLVFHTPLQGIIAAMDNFVEKYPIVPLIGNGKQAIFPCFLEELAQLIFNLSKEQPEIKKPIVAAAEQPVTLKQLVKYLAKQRQKSILLLPIPFYGIYALLKILELCKLSIGLRSDSLLGLQYASSQLDFSETKNLASRFSNLDI